MHVVRMTVPCRSGTVVACPMVWGKGESRCREQGENESWIVRCYPGAGYDGCMAGCLSVHLFLCPFAADEQQCLGYPARQEAKERRIQLPARKTASDKCGKKPPSGSPTEWWSGL